MLDNPIWSSLTGAHRSLGRADVDAAVYESDVSPFGALRDPDDTQCWTALGELVGPGGTVAVSGQGLQPPPGWTSVMTLPGLQMVATERFADAPWAEATVLEVADVPDMLELVRRTEPGPFLPRTYRMGTYLGVRVAGRLVAMAGERLRPAGFTEISAVCTDPDFRGQGLASRLVGAIGAGIRARGEVPFLHVLPQNRRAIRLYEQLGFLPRAEFIFEVAKPPQICRTPQCP